MPELLRIGLLIESSRGFGRQLLRGIVAYGRTHGPWTFLNEERDLGTPLPENLKRWRPHGIIARLASQRLLQQVRAMHVPTVDLFREEGLMAIPGVAENEKAVARVAVDHFLERGFKHFAFCGLAGTWWSKLRADNFAECLARHGHVASMFTCPRAAKTVGLAEVEAHSVRQASLLARWIGDLPKPVAVMAANDMRGQQILSVCGEIGIAVPDEVAVLGVDNDDLQCELCDPPLSSIDTGAPRTGYEAAALLHRMIQGERPSLPRRLPESVHLVTRRSTDVLAIADLDVAEAVRFVRQQALAGMDVERILSRLSFSRSTLGRWFRKWLGRTAAEEITRVRVNHVKELLVTTSLPLDKIAHLSGFQHVESMCRVVKRTVGQTAGQYRRRLQRGGDENC
jgi:LacI family transcriptional regulator